MAAYKLTGDGFVIRESDGAFIPIRSPQNRDTKAYHQWLQRGGIPDPPDVQPAKAPVVSREKLNHVIAAIESSSNWDEFKAAVAGFSE